jgi:hypothetical protein
MARSKVLLAKHVNSFDAAACYTQRMSWVLEHFRFLQDGPCSVCVAVFSRAAAYVLFGGAVADAAVLAGECAFASGLVHFSPRPLAQPPASQFAGCCLPHYACLGVLRPKRLRGCAVVPGSPVFTIRFFFSSCSPVHSSPVSTNRVQDYVIQIQPRHADNVPGKVPETKPHAMVLCITACSNCCNRRCHRCCHRFVLRYA